MCVCGVSRVIIVVIVLNGELGERLSRLVMETRMRGLVVSRGFWSVLDFLELFGSFSVSRVIRKEYNIKTVLCLELCLEVD